MISRCSGGKVTRAKETMSKRHQLRCKDCYFHQEALCALQLDAPCPTFRLGAEGNLTPPRQAPLVAPAADAAAGVRFLPQHQAA
jgi:hypothetical protein